jgi:2-polyprenyl-3-methyl-5-hydroxy-6-metoxy-1,4-benzoquinol methylase
MSMALRISADKDWQRLGRIDPYFGVLSNDRFRSANIDTDAKREFFASGVAHVNKVLAVLETSYGFVPTGTALDFGCGVGRITKALAPHIDKVVGLNIAAGMLEEAKKEALSSGLTNIEYDFSRNNERLRPETYDLAHSYIVLQHIPPRIGENIIRMLLVSIKIGGMGAIHFTISDGKFRADTFVKEFVKTTLVLQNIGNVLRSRPWNYPTMQMNRYSVCKVIQIFSECHVEDFTVYRVDDWGSVGLFEFFQKASPEAALSPWSNPIK